MAQIKSQMKRNITNEKARLRNASKKSEMRTQIKKVRVAVESKDKELANKELVLAIRLIDRAKNDKVIKSNTASRKKSEIQRLVNSLE